MLKSIYANRTHFFWNLPTLLRLRRSAGRQARKNLCGFSFLGIYTELTGEQQSWKSIRQFRIANILNRYSIVDLPRLSRLDQRSILASLDERNADHFHILSLANDTEGVHTTGGISMGYINMELSDAVPAGSSNILAPMQIETERCRSLLEEIIAPLAGSFSFDWSRSLIANLGSLSAVFSANSDTIGNIISDKRLAPFLAAIRNARHHALKMELCRKPIISNSETLINYLMEVMLNSYCESVRIIFLNAGNRLLADEDFGTGSISHVSLNPRAIIKRALELGATAIIIVHNHPSGDPRPSQDDIKTTKFLESAMGLFEIMLHDHLIVSCGGWVSMKSIGVI
jgi:DNA repair protein RadC